MRSYGAAAACGCGWDRGKTAKPTAAAKGAAAETAAEAAAEAAAATVPGAVSVSRTVVELLRCFAHFKVTTGSSNNARAVRVRCVPGGCMLVYVQAC